MHHRRTTTQIGRIVFSLPATANRINSGKMRRRRQPRADVRITAAEKNDGRTHSKTRGRTGDMDDPIENWDDDDDASDCEQQQRQAPSKTTGNVTATPSAARAQNNDIQHRNNLPVVMEVIDEEEENDAILDRHEREEGIFHFSPPDSLPYHWQQLQKKRQERCDVPHSYHQAQLYTS